MVFAQLALMAAARGTIPKQVASHPGWRRALTIGIVVSIAVAPAAAQKKRAKPVLTEIKPAGAMWFLRQDQGRCALRSPVIGGQAITHVEVTTGLYEDEVTALALVPSVALDKVPSQVGVKFGVGPARPFRAFAIPGEIGQAKIVVIFYSDEEPTLDLADGTPFIIATGIETIGVRTRSIAPKLDALRACHKARFVKLGFDILLMDAVATPPKFKAGIAKLFSGDDYPKAALMRKEKGTVGAALLIDPLGKVIRCAIASSSNSKALDDITCLKLSKAKYEPAKDRDGRAIPALFHQNIRWELFD